MSEIYHSLFFFLGICIKVICKDLNTLCQELCQPGKAPDKGRSAYTSADGHTFS